MKRKYTRNIARLRFNQGCLTDCVAYFLNLHPENVPYFVYPRKDWSKRLKKYFKGKGYFVYWKDDKSPPKRGVHIVCGNSLVWKTACHAVIYKNGKLAYDPSGPDNKWHDRRITHRLVIKRIKK